MSQWQTNFSRCCMKFKKLFKIIFIGQRKSRSLILTPEYKAGVWVWLLRRNISFQCPSIKLDCKHLGPCQINMSMGKDIDRLILQKDLSWIHPVFHTSLLIPYLDSASFPNCIPSRVPCGLSSLEPWFWEENNVEVLVGYPSLARSVHKYLVFWWGGSSADNSWERGFFLLLCTLSWRIPWNVWYWKDHITARSGCLHSLSLHDGQSFCRHAGKLSPKLQDKTSSQSFFSSYDFLTP